MSMGAAIARPRHFTDTLEEDPRTVDAATTQSCFDTENHGIYLTFVAGKCLLACGGCPIDVMKEMTPREGSPNLNTEDMIAFLEDVTMRYPVSWALMQGYEPLHPNTLPYTSNVLKSAKMLGIPGVGFITNGQHLPIAFIEWCAENKVGITVSLNSDDDLIHDATRGTKPAVTYEYNELIPDEPFPFSNTLDFLYKTVEVYNRYHPPEVVDQLLTISAVLFSPSRVEELDEFPYFVKSEFGLSNIVFNLYLRDEGNGILTPRAVPESLAALEYLRQVGEESGVTIWGPGEMIDVIEPELRGQFPSLQFHGVPDPFHVRLTQFGACKVSGVHKGILGVVDNETPIYYPEGDPRHEPASVLLKRLRPDIERYALGSVA